MTTHRIGYAVTVGLILGLLVCIVAVRFL